MSKGITIEKIVSIVFVVAFACVFISCASASKLNVKPVENFDVSRYLGDWYEIGRFDFKWEKDMKNVRANYSLNEDGSVKVVNSGYDYIAQKDKQSVGKAKFAGDQKDIANLKVSFFGPFYSAYTVIALDADYKYALVAGANNKLLWILSRTPTIPDDVKQNYVQVAEAAGYDLTDFIWTVQE